MTQQPPQQITVEWEMPVQLSFNGITGSFKSTVVGMERNQYLICSLPHIPGIWVKLHGRNQTIVRYVHGGVVYGFKSTLLGIIEEPFRLGLFLYPEDVETVKLRQHDRLPCLIPATGKLGETSLDGALLDLSVSGCCFTFAVSPEDQISDNFMGEELAVSVQLPGRANDLAVTMVVGNIRRQEAKIAIGGPFKGLDADTSTALQNFVERMGRLVELNRA